MAAAELILFMDDMLHINAPSIGTFSASSTQNGYAIDNARETDLVKAWKPNNGVSDEYVRFDPTTDSSVGTNGEIIYFAYAYDARGTNQNVIRWRAWDGGAFATNSHTVDKTMVNCFWDQFTMPATPYQYYELAQLNSERSGGTTTAKIFNWAMFNTTNSDVIRIAGVNPFASDTEASYDIAQVFRVAHSLTGGGHTVANEYAKPGQKFSVSFGPASRTLWGRVRDDLYANGGTKRGIYVQKTGLKNAAKADFYLCKMIHNEWVARLTYLDQYPMSIEFETLPWL